MKKTLFSDTFVRNEFSTILGKRLSNLWILLAVFIFSIAALEFSRSGIKYLSYKMNDPFINWIQIQQQGKFETFKQDMSNQDVMAQYGIGASEANNFINQTLYNLDGKSFISCGRSIAYDSRLLSRILDDDNVVGQCRKELREDDFGWIVTQEKMELMGYDDPSNYPMFIHVSQHPNPIIDEWGIPVLCEGQMDIPIPLLAVVKQLPDLLDFIAPKLFYMQWKGGDLAFLLSNHRDYFNDLNFVVADTVGVINRIYSVLNSVGIDYDPVFEVSTYKYTLNPTYRIRIAVNDSIATNVNKAGKAIAEKVPEANRIYNWNFTPVPEISSDYQSFLFDDLSKVGDFAKMANHEYGIRIDMAQIEAKNNFNTFNILASVLCAAIMIISVLFVAIFLWFLIDAHFKSISKNLGTIMAFGLPNRTIVSIYRTVFLRLILLALGISLAFLIVVQLILLLAGITREAGMQYINILDFWVWLFIIVVPILTAVVVTLTMKKKLEAKPGDLIFERNS